MWNYFELCAAFPYRPVKLVCGLILLKQFCSRFNITVFYFGVLWKSTIQLNLCALLHLEAFLKTSLELYLASHFPREKGSILDDGSKQVSTHGMQKASQLSGHRACDCLHEMFGVFYSDHALVGKSKIHILHDSIPWHIASSGTVGNGHLFLGKRNRRESVLFERVLPYCM